MASLIRPSSRNDFSIAIICALSREFDAVSLLIDRFWDDDDGVADGGSIGQARGDSQHYVHGRIDNRDLVLLNLSAMGTVSSAAAAAHLRQSYPNIRLALVVGICGGIPSIDGVDVFQGDVIISRTIVQYDLGTRYPEQFVVKKAIEDSLGRAGKPVRDLLARFDTARGRDQLEAKAGAHFTRLQQAAAREHSRIDYGYPGLAGDRLFPPDYRHAHRDASGIKACCAGSTCDAAIKAVCEKTGCDEASQVVRTRERRAPLGTQEAADQGSGNTNSDFRPAVFIGRLASGNTVLKSGLDRDRLAEEHGAIAFEMEGAGVWDELPCALVVKGVCDYADSHKDKARQHLAAATAAAVARAVIESLPREEGAVPVASSRSREEMPPSHVRFGNQGHGVQAGVINGGLTYQGKS